MARPSDKSNPITAHVIAALASLARAIMERGTHIDKLALFNAVQASEYVARWRNDTTEMSRRNAFARAFACGELASLESNDLQVTMTREALTAYSRAIAALCEGFPDRALAFAESARALGQRL